MPLLTPHEEDKSIGLQYVPCCIGYFLNLLLLLEMGGVVLLLLLDSWHN